MTNQSAHALRATLKSSASFGWAKAGGVGVLLALPLLVSPSFANPLSGAVTTGSASVSSSSSKTTIDQKSEDVVINWSSFNIGAGQTTQFVQPNAQAIAVNRIGGNSESQILGTLDANGRIVLINSNGMLFGKGSQVSVGALVATSTGGSDSDVLSGKFTQAGNPNAAVVNQGNIRTSQGGLVALVAPNVSNAGIVNARFGTVAVGAANKFTVDFTGDGLVSFAAQGDVNGKAAATNTGSLLGANVSLTAHAAEGVATGVVTMSGIVTAQTAKNIGGTILLDAGDGALSMTGTLNAAGTTGGGSIETSGNQVAISGTVTAGKNGNWKVDPYNLIVEDSVGFTIDEALNAGTNVLLQTTAGGTSGPGYPVAGPGDIVIEAGITWHTASTLTLDAYHSVVVENAIKASAGGGLDIVTDDGGSGGIFSVAGGNSHIIFQNLSSGLTINGNAYTLVDTVAALANDIAANPSGDFALADSTNAGAEGIYSAPPIAAIFTGEFEGLGNTISDLKIDGATAAGQTGLFATIGAGGDVENIDLANVRITGRSGDVGALAGEDEGTISGASVSGKIEDKYSSSTVGGMVGLLSGGTIVNSKSAGIVEGLGNSAGMDIGGLVGDNETGIIENSFSSAAIKNGETSGGLVGLNDGVIEGSSAAGDVASNYSNVSLGGLVGVNGNDNAVISNSFATGDVSSSGGTEHDVFLGGLVGYNDGANGSATVTGSYAAGSVTVSGTPKANARDQIDAGGLVGYDQGTLSDLNATGAVSGSEGSVVGGLVGYAIGTISNSYATGAVTGAQSTTVGGLAGAISGAVDNSYAEGTVSGGDNAIVGGLVGNVEGAQSSVSDSFANGAVTGGDNAQVGGLVGQNLGAIDVSFADGAVLGGDSSQVGGLVGQNEGVIDNIYATGSVKGGDNAYVGGLVGDNAGGGLISYSYESGALMGGANASVGGLVGWGTGGSYTDDYWDITTTGAAAGQGGGSASPSGITALTTAQLQAWLPTGFDPSIWGRNGYANGGLPYLLALE
jgi:filamentous hemagglutinin family protein